MRAEAERSPVLAAPGLNNDAGLDGCLTKKTNRTKARKIQCLSKKEAAALEESHRPLVLSVATKHAGKGVEFKELLSAGRLGLAQALRRFDPGLGYTFGAYAKHRIDGAMRDCLKPRSDALGCGRSKSIHILEPDAVLDEVSPAPPLPKLSCLADRERYVVESRDSGETLKEVACALNISNERVRQIETKARAKLRDPVEDAFRVSPGDIDAREFRKEYLGYRKLGLAHLRRRHHKAPVWGKVTPLPRKTYPCRSYNRAEIEAYERGEL